MTSFQATLINAGYGQLALRDQNGKISQKWTLGGPKCVIGAHPNCNVRCMLPGVADRHLLLVIGARQVYLRALAAGVERDGVAVNELLLSGNQFDFALTVAGHRFEYSRAAHATPSAKAFVEEGSSLPGSQPTGLPATGSQQSSNLPPASKRLRFTFVQALEKSRDQSQPDGHSATAAEASAGASQRPAWVEEIVRDALRPVELRLETIAQPINNLERQLRRQRARLRKAQRSRKLSQHAAHDTQASHSQQLSEGQETIQKIVADQAARLEVVNERVSDILNQLASLERIVAGENAQHHEVVTRSSESGEEIIRLQREMLALVGALQTRIDQPPSAGENAQWRASVERQLDELHQSLGILDEIKLSLDVAVSQNRELTQDLQSHWQAIEEAAKRPVVIESVPVPPTQRPATPPATPPVPATLAAESPSALGDLRVDSEAANADPVQLPSWWGEDPVAPSDANPPAATKSPAGLVFADDSVEDNDNDNVGDANAAANGVSNPESHLPGYSAPSSQGDRAEGSNWRATEFEQEADPRQLGLAWDYAPPVDSAPENDYPPLDVPQLLTSAIADPPAASLYSPLTYAETATAEPDCTRQPGLSKPSYAEQTFDDQTFDPTAFAEHPYAEQAFADQAAQAYADPTSAEPNDVRDASSGINQSASQLEDQLQKWLTDDYRNDGLEDAPEEHGGMRLIQPGHLDVDPTAPQLADESVASDDDYAVSAFSAERLSIEDSPSELAQTYGDDPRYGDDPKYGNASPYSDASHSDASDYIAESESAETAYQLPYQQADEVSSSHSPASGQAASQAVAAEGGEESVEDYMRRLLARMRGVSETEVTLPGLDRQEAPTPEPPARARQVETSAPLSNASGKTESVSETWTEPFDPTNYVPRVTTPENNHNIDALRELANTSARSAIHVSARRKHGTAIMIKSAVALVGLAAGAALVSINGLRINIGLVATLASFMVALIWGYDALATLRPLLQASRGAKFQLRKPIAEESEDSEEVEQAAS